MSSKVDYPKSSAHPSRVVGEVLPQDSWPSGSTLEYPGAGVGDTRFDGHKNRTITLGGGVGGGEGGKDYPKKTRKFGTEGFR